MSRISSDDAAIQSATAKLRRLLPDLYFINTPLAQHARHLDLLRRVESEGLLLDFYSAPLSSLTECTICAFDAGPGLLAKVCAALVSQRVDVQTAFVFSARTPGEKARSKRRIILDTFWLSESYRGQARALPPKTIARVRAELTHVLNGGSVPLLRKYRSSALSIDELSAVNTAARDLTLITLRARNSRGVLHRATAALAALDLDICIAQINTEDKNTSDVFFVSKDGKALSETELLQFLPHLRTLLQNLPLNLDH